MYPTNNLDVRIAIRESGLYGYQVAKLLGITETSFSRSLSRKELPPERKEKIFAICNDAKAREEAKQSG